MSNIIIFTIVQPQLHAFLLSSLSNKDVILIDTEICRRLPQFLCRYSTMQTRPISGRFPSSHKVQSNNVNISVCDVLF